MKFQFVTDCQVKKIRAPWLKMRDNLLGTFVSAVETRLDFFEFRQTSKHTINKIEP